MQPYQTFIRKHQFITVLYTSRPISDPSILQGTSNGHVTRYGTLTIK